MPSVRQRAGTIAEDQAAEYLVARGFQILDRHVTSRFGEIDVLALDGEIVVAVEVKARRNAKFGRAVESLTEAKLTRIANTLHEVLSERGWATRPYRIDLVTIEPAGIQHLIGIGPTEVSNSS